MKIIPILICCFLLNGQFVINATALRLAKVQDSSNATDSGLIDASEKIVSRQKRQIVTSIVAGILTTAAGIVGQVVLTEYYRAAASDECKVTISYKQNLHVGSQTGNSALNMNFKATYDDNWNYEVLDDMDGVDQTKEKVTGGFLTLIKIHSVKRFCIEGIIFSCGSQLNRNSIESSVILDPATIKNALAQHGNPSQIDTDGQCVWFSDYASGSVRAIDVYADAFTECKNAAEDCISNYIRVL